MTTEPLLIADVQERPRSHGRSFWRIRDSQGNYHATNSEWVAALAQRLKEQGRFARIESERTWGFYPDIIHILPIAVGEKETA
jgi:cyclopropane fatty-acyl-phospholipid synthase-like methyltransferase